jgi:hypothetical protein
MENRRVSIKLARIDGHYAFHQEVIVTATDWNDNYFRRYSEVLPIVDFGNFGDLEFAVYDMRTGSVGRNENDEMIKDIVV